MKLLEIRAVGVYPPDFVVETAAEFGFRRLIFH
jgi:hypothetical protein